MAYAHITFAQLQFQLAERLDDTSNIFWKSSEIPLYIQEAFRWWQAATSFWRGRMSFQASSGAPQNPWYDLTQQAGTLIPYTITDSQLVSLMLYQLIEPQLSNGNYVGTGMFTLDDFTKSIERRRNQFLMETGLVTTQSIVTASGLTSGRLPLSDNVIDVRRVSWLAAGVYTSLWKTDEWAAAAFQSGWANNPVLIPNEYSTAVVPPITLQLVPPPSVNGQVELVTVNTGASLNPSTGVLLGVPDNFAWVVKFGSLADLLAMDGESKDIERARYCQQRWEEGIALAKIHSSVLTTYIAGVQGFPISVRELSTYQPSWENVSGTPNVIAAMSWNLMATSPVPDNLGPYTITMDVVQNAPVPVNASDQIQLGREDLDAILDYSEHLAAFKQGGGRFSDTTYLYQNAVRQAKIRNSKIMAEIPFYEPLSSVTERQEEIDPSEKAQQNQRAR